MNLYETEKRTEEVIYERIKIFLIDKGYKPVVLCSRIDNSISLLLFIEPKNNAVAAFLAEKIISDEENHSDEEDEIRIYRGFVKTHTSCKYKLSLASGLYVKHSEGIENLLSAFENGFEDFINNTILCAESFKNPEFAIRDYANQQHWKIQKTDRS